MRIAICGAHGVGKTTISRIIAEEFDLPVLPDIVVTAHKKGFTINENTPIETQVWLTAQQLENEKFTEKFVADKCIFDYYVYAGALGMHPDVVSTAKLVALNTYKYDYVFYIHPEFPIEDDGVRSTNVAFQQAIDVFYKQFLSDHNIPHVVLTGSVEERKQQVMTRIRFEFMVNVL